MRQQSRKKPHSPCPKVEILEDRTLPDAASAFLTALYHSEFGRPVDPSGLAHWSQLLQDGTSRTEIALAVVQSHEEHVDFLETQFQTLLARQADPLGLQNYTAALDADWSRSRMQAALLGSNEFFRLAGGSNTQFLKSLYHDLLNRDIDPSGEATFSRALELGITRTTVAAVVLQSDECALAEVQSLYAWLQRPADDSGLASWTRAIHSGASMEQVMAAILGSDEYLALATPAAPTIPGGANSTIGSLTAFGGVVPTVTYSSTHDQATFQNQAGATITISSPGAVLSDIEVMPAPAHQATLPWGLFNFKLSGLEANSIAIVTITLPADARPNAYDKYDPATGHIIDFSFNGQIGSQITKNVITLRIKDNSFGDLDPTPGEILDPGGPAVTSTSVVTGADAGASPLVKVFDPATQAVKLSFLAYASTFRGGVRVALGDVSGDGVPDIITAPGPGGGSLVKVWSGTDGSLIRSFNGYAAGVTDGVYVAAGDVNGDGYADIITGTESGAQPLVKVYSGKDGSLLASFLADDATMTGGVRVAAADVNGDGKADIVTGDGPGGQPRVTVFDGGTDKPIYNFFAYDTTIRGGIYVAAGDLNGDGQADIVVGPGSGMRPEIRTFNGKDSTPMANFLAFGATFQGGVRVAVVDTNGNGLGEIVVGAGPGGNNVQLFDGLKGTAVGQGWTPYDAGSSYGAFVGSVPPAVLAGPPPDPNSYISVAINTGPGWLNETGGSGAFIFNRGGDVSGSFTVNYSVSGSATNGTDYQTLSGTVNFNPYQLAAPVALYPLDDAVAEGPQSVVVTVQSGTGYNVSTPSSASYQIIEEDGPPPVVPQDSCGCGPDLTDLVQKNSGTAMSGSMYSEGPVRYADGTVRLNSTDLVSNGFGTPWAQTRSWTNAADPSSSTTYGTGSEVSQLPFLTQDSNGTVIVNSNGTTARYFDLVSGVYQERFYLQETLVHSTSTHDFTLTDTEGDTIKFQDFSISPTAEEGLFKSFVDPDGHSYAVTSYTSAGQVGELQRSDTTGGVTNTESWLYSYLTTGNNSGKLSNVTLRRQVNGGSWTTIRQVADVYFDYGDSFGNLGDLKEANVEMPDGTILDTSYYRYYTSGNYQHGLKYAFGPQSFARLSAAVGNPLTASDSSVSPYADLYLEFDSFKRVTKEIVQGVGCSSCSGGLGTYAFSYTSSVFPNGYNSYAMKTVETLPDNNTNTVYTNFAGEEMLKVYTDVGSGSQWKTFNEYDNSGRLILSAAPSAVTGFDDTHADLLNNQSGNYQYLSDSTGLIQITDYYTSTTAGETTAGGVAGYYQDTKIRQGETGTAILQATDQYFAHTANSITVNPLATHTVYRNTDGTGGETTSYSYTWFSSTMRMQSATASLPTISSGQNGPGSADQTVTFFDTYGRPIWTKDADGFLTYIEYDISTGAVTKQITDVDSTRSSDFQNLPSGWSTPSGGGLHLITQMQVDGLGRTTKLTDPNGNITYTVYLDTNYEYRVYPGWQTGTNTTTGPTQDYREDRHSSTSYFEVLTMSAAPHVTSGAPDGTEAIASLQTLSRSYFNAAGQNTRSDAYFSLSGVTWATSLYIGTQNTNFYTTLYDFDERGRPNRTQLPTGTINRKVYDGLGRVVSTWVGTNDTPGSGYWSPTNNTSPSNMIQITGNVYDGGSVGDGNLTQVTQYPGGSAANRVAQYFYDWRDRLVAGKQGVQGTEDTTTHRPIIYNTFDNLEITLRQQFDGDGVTITSTSGVPNAPSSGLLRAETASSYDDQGRVYQTVVYDVNQSTGSVSSTGLTTNIYFNHRGQVIETSNPGGLVRKAQHDGAGRVIEQYDTDGASGTSWSSAGSVSSDHVLDQSDMQYVPLPEMIGTFVP